MRAGEMVHSAERISTELAQNLSEALKGSMPQASVRPAFAIRMMFACIPQLIYTKTHPLCPVLGSVFLQVLLRLLGQVCLLDGSAQHPKQLTRVSSSVLLVHRRILRRDARRCCGRHQEVRQEPEKRLYRETFDVMSMACFWLGRCFCYVDLVEL